MRYRINDFIHRWVRAHNNLSTPLICHYPLEVFIVNQRNITLSEWDFLHTKLQFTPGRGGMLGQLLRRAEFVVLDDMLQLDAEGRLHAPHSRFHVSIHNGL